MMMRNLNIRIKLLLICGLLSGAMVAVGVIGYLAIQSVSDKYSWVTNNSISKIKLSDEMYLSYKNVRIALRTLGLPGISDRDADQAIEDTHAAIEHYEKSFLEYSALGYLEDEQELDDHVATTWQDFKETSIRIIGLYRSGTPVDRAKMLEIFFVEGPQKADVFSKAISKVVEFHRDFGDRKFLATKVEATRARNMILLLLALGTILCVMSTLMFSAAISKALTKVVDILSNTSSELTSEVSQMTHSSTELSAAASQQAGAIQETSAAIEEIRAMVAKNSQSAVTSAQKSETSMTKAERGQKVIREMIHSMSEIEVGNQSIVKEITESNHRLNEVVKIISEIVDKTKVIDNIVFQTKLLSFNASVEAARAGENGKGFAVVAEEVGKLAQMSGVASKEISEMLNSSVKKVEGIAVETQGRVEGLIKTAQTTVSRGSQVAKECEQVLKEIVESTHQVFDIVHEISSASQEQSLGINEIAKAIQELDSTTQTNSVAAASTAASASTISLQLKTLKKGNEHLRGVILGEKHAKKVARFIWSERFALGVHEMDGEHKVLIEKINRLAEIFEKRGMSAAALSAPFTDLAEYTKQHFSHEEAYMASIQYPGLSNHKVIHRKLLAGIDEFSNQLQNSQLDGDNLVAFLNDWLIRHILGIDMKYAAYAKEEVGRVNRVA